MGCTVKRQSFFLQCSHLWGAALDVHASCCIHGEYERRQKAAKAV